MIKILSWNIQQGGGSRIASIWRAISAMKADIVVLSEYRNNQSGVKLRQLALINGYRYQWVTAASPSNNSVMIISLFPGGSKLFTKVVDDTYYHSILKVDFDAFSVYGMYLPHKKKHSLFELLIDRVYEEKPAIFCGDMNTGINNIDQSRDSFWYEDQFKVLLSTGMIDAFRHINGPQAEYSWFSHQGNGYRYDHTLVHQVLAPLIKGCKYLHEYRSDGSSDHSPMILTIG